MDYLGHINLLNDCDEDLLLITRIWFGPDRNVTVRVQRLTLSGSAILPRCEKDFTFSMMGFEILVYRLLDDNIIHSHTDVERERFMRRCVQAWNKNSLLSHIRCVSLLATRCDLLLLQIRLKDLHFALSQTQWTPIGESGRSSETVHGS